MWSLIPQWSIESVKLSQRKHLKVLQNLQKYYKMHMQSNNVINFKIINSSQQG